ncbi:type VII toxin-antitoxin system HepT family RNase toxin [Methanosarcina sp. T3]|uniref:type VII toxin-antitoxin system HepT family RNase toxin n=1 Tax=Methanosarcina sp. T3 TaxID=3439062 RepID=UPI003F845A22
MRQEVIDKLELLEGYIAVLKDLQQYSFEEIEKNYVLRGAVERYLQISLECMLDIGEIIISMEKIKRPQSYKEVFRTLGENGILPESFARKIEPAAGFRNILVHMYAKVEVDKLYENLQNGVKDMEVFIEYVARFLAEKKD